GVVERLVGAVDEGRDRRRGVGDAREAGAHGDAAHAGKLELLHRGAEALERLAAAAAALDAVDQHELLAAEAVQQVARAERLAHEVGEEHEDLVAVEVAEAVVDALEEVDVEHAEEVRAARVDPAPEPGLDVRLENAPVPEPRERVRLRIAQA